MSFWLLLHYTCQILEVSLSTQSDTLAFHQHARAAMRTAAICCTCAMAAIAMQLCCFMLALKALLDQLCCSLHSCYAKASMQKSNAAADNLLHLCRTTCRTSGFFTCCVVTGESLAVKPCTHVNNPLPAPCPAAAAAAAAATARPT